MRIESLLPALAPRLQAFASAARPFEACGVIAVSGDLVELKNRAVNPTRDFDIGPLHEVPDDAIAIWHTHPDDETPTPTDVANCRASALPWVIAGPTKTWAIHPKQIPLTQREFVYGIEDCWQCVSDWFAQERGMFLPWFSRPKNGWWKEEGVSPYLEAAGSYGFTVRPIAEIGFTGLHVGDVLLMQVLGKRVNHAAVYVGGGAILHHLYGHLSAVEQLCTPYQERTYFVGRHESLAS